MSAPSKILALISFAGLGIAGFWFLSGPPGIAQSDSAASSQPESSGAQDPSRPSLAPHVDSGAGAPQALGSTQQPTAGDLGKLLNDKNQNAINLLKDKRYQEAEGLFRECLDARPEEPAFSANLAEALVRRALAEFDSKPEAAFEALLEAIALGRTDLQDLRSRWSKILEAQADYAEDQSQHFILQYDGARDELLSSGYLQVLEDLEAAYQDYGEFFDIFPVDSGRDKFSVVLYDRDVFDSVTGMGEWAGGAFDGTIRVPVRNFQRDHARIREVLRHELVHAFIQEIGGKQVPGWLNEGLAQYLSPEGDAARGREVQRALARLKGATPLAFDTLTGTLAGLPDAATIRKAYDQSLGFTNWIAFHYGERTLIPMVTGCKQGLAPATSFQRLLHFELSAPIQDFLDSL